MLISFSEVPNEKRWFNCISALEHEYTLSFKEMCRILKCSRSWANRYLKPNLHYIYLSNGCGKSADYVSIARNHLEKETMTECTWYSKDEFLNFVSSCITNVTRQTIAVPVEMLIDKKKLDSFLAEFNPLKNIENEYISKGDIKEYKRKLKQHDATIVKYATSDGLLLFNNRPSIYKRSDVIPVSCTSDVIDVLKFQAVHDLKDYGDSDEEIYRDLFSKGYYRLVLQIPDKNGVLSEKIYYMEPNNDFNMDNSVESVLIRYSDYRKFLY